MALGKRSSHSNHSVHPDEKWLVSYSDMMTLLFGFFVLMYALAAENPKGASALSEIAEALSGKPKTESVALPMATISQKELQELKEKLSALEKLQNSLATQSANETQVKEELAALKTNFEQKQLEVEALKNELKVEQTAKDSDPSKDRIKLLENQASLAKSELARMQKLIEEMKSKNFLMVMTKWDTEKHDLDLTIKSPTGGVYNYKNRKVAGAPGELILDSRYGPGAEIWSSNKIMTGTYEARISLYNQYGNLADAIVETTLVSGLGNIKLPMAKLNKSGVQSLVYYFNVDDEGHITVKNNP